MSSKANELSFSAPELSFYGMNGDGGHSSAGYREDGALTRRSVRLVGR